MRATERLLLITAIDQYDGQTHGELVLYRVRGFAISTSRGRRIRSSARGCITAAFFAASHTPAPIGARVCLSRDFGTRGDP